MANPFVKGWRYMMALFGAKIDEYADPKVQIQQAIEDRVVVKGEPIDDVAEVLGVGAGQERRLFAFGVEGASRREFLDIVGREPEPAEPEHILEKGPGVAAIAHRMAGERSRDEHSIRHAAPFVL